MTKRWIPVILAAVAIALAGCNKQESGTTEVETETEATTEGAVDATPDGTESTPEAPPAEMVPPADPAGTPADQAAAPADDSAAAPAGGEVTLPGGTKYVDEVVGNGAEAVEGRQVVVHYTGTLTDGTKFDSSRDRNDPFPFTLGAGEVIDGWDEGVAGMKVGGKRKLTIPPDQGYGSRAMGPIPPNSTLLFDVELIDVR